MDTSISKKDRRSFKRVSFRELVWTLSSGQLSAHRAVDISEGGLCLDSAVSSSELTLLVPLGARRLIKAFRGGERVLLPADELGGRDLVKLDAKVVWRDEENARTGVSFVARSPAVAEGIARLRS